MFELFIYGLNGLCLSECLVMVNVVYRCHIYCLQAMPCPFLMAVTPRSFGILLLVAATNEENASSELVTFGVL